MLRTFQVNDKCKPFYTKAALFEGNCEQDPVKRCQDGPVVEGARLKVISWLRDGFRGRVWVFWSPSGGVGSNPTPGMFSILSYRKTGILSRTDAHKFAFTPAGTWYNSTVTNFWEFKLLTFSAKTWPSFTKSKQLRMTVFLCKSKLPVWTFLCRTLQDSGFSTLKGLFVLRLIR